MSLQKDSCERCWLPPCVGDTLCRKCRGVPPHELSRWIRYHTTSPEGCTRYRKIINEERYYGSAIPQDCLHCCNFILRLGNTAWTAALKQHIRQTSHHDLATILVGNLERTKDAVLDYVDALLEFHQADHLTCKKIVNALGREVDAVDTKRVLREIKILRHFHHGNSPTVFCRMRHCNSHLHCQDLT